MYFDKIDDIVSKYNNKYHSTIKMNPVVVKSNTYSKHFNYKNPKFKIGDIAKRFLQKVTLQIGLREYL